MSILSVVRSTAPASRVFAQQKTVLQAILPESLITHRAQPPGESAQSAVAEEPLSLHASPGKEGLGGELTVKFIEGVA
jgi:hypothetical protein